MLFFLYFVIIQATGVFYMILQTKNCKFKINNLGQKISDNTHEGYVYHYQDEKENLAIKKFRKSYIEEKSLTVIENSNLILSKIKTDYILVPKYLLYNIKSQFSAIAIEYKNDQYNNGALLEMKIKDFMNNVFGLIKDIDKMSEKIL